MSDTTPDEAPTQIGAGETNGLASASGSGGATESIWTRKPDPKMVLVSIAALTVFSGFVGGMVGGTLVAATHDDYGKQNVTTSGHGHDLGRREHAAQHSRATGWGWDHSPLSSDQPKLPASQRPGAGAGQGD